MFVARHDANKMSAPLGTEFLFREKELEKAKSALHDNDVLLIAGPAGVGKTRFAWNYVGSWRKRRVTLYLS